MATVYLAEDLKHDRKVALKVLKPDLAAVIGAERFVVEIKTTAALQHPHILPLFDSGSADGFLYYVMPYIQGETLRSKLDRETQLGIDEAVKITTDVADALDYAHRHGVIHRDIKPANILLHDGRPMVADFGIALALSAAAGGRMTETGLSLGTPHYMSPEQATGERGITNRSDIYSLGSVLYEMLTGNPPHTGASAQQIIMKIVTEDAAPVTRLRKSVPTNIAAAIATAVEKLPADRFDSAKAFADALKNPGYRRDDMAGGAGNASASERRMSRLTIPLGVALALAVVAAGWGWTRARAAADRPIERHYISLSDSVPLQTARLAGPPLAISADGSRLAFLGDSLSRIWIKRLDDLNPAVLPGTEHATSPVFSPDGQWIAYTAGTQLKKVRVDGGASITIADSVSVGYGVAWLDDGTLVYPSVSLLGLRRVNESGGAVSVVLPDTVFKGLAPIFPTPLPHTRGLIFQVCSSGCVTMSLHVLDFKTGQHKLLFNDVAMGWYLPNGDLLYVRRDGVALVAPFDLSKLETRGAGVPVLQGVSLNWALARLAWSRSGTLVYGVGTSTSAIVTLQHEDRAGVTAPFDPAWTGEFNSFAISPDGRRAAVGVTTPGAGFDIWVKQLDGGPFSRLTFSGHDRRPTWSPDGREVAFVRDSGSGGDVYARIVDGGGSDRRLAHLDKAIQEVSWSHDGRWLLVRTETAAAGNGDILAVSTNGDSPVVPVATSTFTELQPALSPDGRSAAYVSNESGINEIYVRPFPNAEAGRWQVSNGGGGSPVWSADGKELFFLNGANRLIAAQLASGPAFHVSELKPLFDATRFNYLGYHQAFEVTRDGRFIFLDLVGSAAVEAIRLVQVDNWFSDIKAKLKP